YITSPSHIYLTPLSPPPLYISLLPFISPPSIRLALSLTLSPHPCPSKTPCRRSLVCLNPGSFFTHINFLNRVHMNPANPIESAVVHPPRQIGRASCST